MFDFSQQLQQMTTEVIKDDFLRRRPRRNRQNPAIRSILQETHLLPCQLIAPLFVMEGLKQKDEISSMPGIYRFTLDYLIEEVKILYKLGIRAIDLFCKVPQEKKDSRASEAIRTNNLLQQAIRLIKKEIPSICVMVDIALDPYTDHGHDGLVKEGLIDNDTTLEVLAKMSLLAAEAGADIIAPSDMMDGRVAYLRNALDQNGFYQVGILSYAVKYASSFYGPFRDALNSSPKFGDKKTYQLNPGNTKEALLESFLDEQEGADMLLIKPALPYLDIISKVKASTHLPVGAYHVSGEYSMVMAAAEKGWVNAEKIFEESLISIKRAGADFILTYAAKMMAIKLKRDLQND